MPTTLELCRQFEEEVGNYHLDTHIAYYASGAKKVLLNQLKKSPSLLQAIGHYISEANRKSSTDNRAKMREAWGMFLQEYYIKKEMSLNDVLFSWAKGDHAT